LIGSQKDSKNDFSEVKQIIRLKGTMNDETNDDAINIYDAGYFYAPYIPLIRTPIFYETEEDLKVNWIKEGF